MDAQIFAQDDSSASTITIKVNSINFRKSDPLLRTNFVLNWRSIITKASMLYISHPCIAQCQPVRSLCKFLAHILPALEGLWRLLFQFLMFPWNLTPFADPNTCTADSTKLFHSSSILIIHKSIIDTLIHLNSASVENCPWLITFVKSTWKQKTWGFFLASFLEFLK